MNHDIGIHALHPQSSPLMATLAFALALNQHNLIYFVHLQHC